MAAILLLGLVCLVAFGIPTLIHAGIVVAGRSTWREWWYQGYVLRPENGAGVFFGLVCLVILLAR